MQLSLGFICALTRTTGWSGLAAVKTYLEVNPSSNVVLLEAASSVGGVWAKDRLYKGLKSNNMLGTYEFSDFPMDASFGVKPGEHIPGHVVQSYLESYADHFQFTNRIRLDTRVRSAEHKPDGSWLLAVSRPGGEVTIATKKLIMATGITSEPYLPSFQGQEDFSAPLFHCRDLLQYDKVIQPDRRVAVFGGTKSAWDAVYACATSGMQVDWIIRESGHGPIWMAPPYVTPLKKWLEKLVTTRLLTWFSPCIWGEASGFGGIVRRFLHGTWLGRKIVDGFWTVLASDVLELNAYDKHPETKKLKPWVSPFWIASSLSILNYPTNIFDLVRNGSINVHIADIDRLSRNCVHLSTSEIVPTTALVCSTGWKATPNIEFLPKGIDQSLGFPWAEDSIDDTLVKKAGEDIFERFPKLRAQPCPNPKFRPLTEAAEAATPHPFRLHRFIVPTAFMQERSIAFVGVTMTINTPLLAQTQALWVAAYLSNRLTPAPASRPPPSVSGAELKRKIPEQSSLDLEWETALHTEFCKFRYPAGFGRRNPDFVFDAVPYVDMLLGDLGLDCVRRTGFWSMCLAPYGMEDYKGLVAEWLGGKR